MADEDVCTDDEVVTFETYVDEGSDTVDEFEDSAVTELDTVDGVVESVQFSTLITLSSNGIRVMVHIFVTVPKLLD